MTDKKELQKLFKQHYRQMYRLATILLHDDAESKDVVHDIFVHLLDSQIDLKEETAESCHIGVRILRVSHRGQDTS